MTTLERSLLKRFPAGIEPCCYRHAKEVWRDYRADHGRAHLPIGSTPYLTAPDGNYKLNKARVATFGLSLAPHRDSGHNVCPWSTKTCRAHCVSYSGKGSLSGVSAGRIIRTRFLSDHPREAVALIIGELKRAQSRHGIVACRLNTFSDIRWEHVAPIMFECLPCVTFYDYTKAPANLRQNLPPNYHLTRSATERDQGPADVIARAAGGTVALVVDIKRGRPLPATYNGRPVVDGDETDARWLDRPGSVVMLRAKGSMRGDSTGFVHTAS